ncbi:MAG: CBS domain-containing protein [Hyphomicrobiaceae bacterium]|nr:CBS domain-containing protein [Hyphomicrobiaceae bacterium]
MTVAAILKDKGRDVVTVTANHTIAQVCDLLATHKIGAVVVVEGSDLTVHGIISERDVVRAVARGGAAALASSVGDHMTATVKTCMEADTIEQVAQVMSTGRFRHMPVTQGGKLVGLISIGDVVKRRIDNAVREAEDMRAYITAA